MDIFSYPLGNVISIVTVSAIYRALYVYWYVILEWNFQFIYWAELMFVTRKRTTVTVYYNFTVKEPLLYDNRK